MRAEREQLLLLLAERLHAELLAAAEGLSEHQLLSRLREDGVLSGDLAEPLELYRCHFLLFHALYRLRERLWSEGQAHLEINALCIRLYPYREAVAALASPDPLRDYYLDLGQLEQTGEQEVLELLAAFWGRYQAHRDGDEALAVLGLTGCDPESDWPRIRRRYRELAMRHHPDRGGKTAELQRINAAMASLERRRGR